MGRGKERTSTDLTHGQIAELLGGKANRPTPTHKEIQAKYGGAGKAEEERKVRASQVIRVTKLPLVEDKIDEFMKWIQETEAPTISEKKKKRSMISFLSEGLSI